ncbi:hypothetical protein VKI22_10450 [Cyanobacterium aponinum UTEX 3221]|uniref:hypothetical protein n=1 Tax=Cyanobacterium aponinum TaxID=379064 RepID=UPI002B4BB8B4|nr:hypothetical protein [Cyanobacterium aponinum]WRL37050.1 hypothetical protein VKI22_10450 [Cyanobacterium aponinum UTEX 3221]
MALTDHKIPILTGINDVPSTEGQPNHPNDSLLCNKYNALIDNIPTEVQGIARSAISVSGSGGSYDPATGVITLSGGSSEFIFDGDNWDFSDLIAGLSLNFQLVLFYDLSGRFLSSSGASAPSIASILGLSPVEFYYNGTFYPVNQTNTFWFGDINISTGSLNINFTLNTSAVTSDLLIPFTIYYEDSSNNSYPLNVDIVVTSTIVDSISADPANSGGSGSGGSGSI